VKDDGNNDAEADDADTDDVGQYGDSIIMDNVVVVVDVDVVVVAGGIDSLW
jgi:hypothetical protein